MMHNKHKSNDTEEHTHLSGTPRGKAWWLMAASQNLCVDESAEEKLWVSGGFGVPLSTAQHNST